MGNMKKLALGNAMGNDDDVDDADDDDVDDDDDDDDSYPIPLLLLSLIFLALLFHTLPIPTSPAGSPHERRGGPMIRSISAAPKPAPFQMT